MGTTVTDNATTAAITVISTIVPVPIAPSCVWVRP